MKTSTLPEYLKPLDNEKMRYMLTKLILRNNSKLSVMKWEDSKKGYENYLKLEKSLSQNSIASYINDINQLIIFLDDKFKKLAPEKVKLQHLKRFVKWLNSKNLSPGTQARKISVIRSFYKFLLIEGKITSDPTALLESPKIVRKLPDILTIEEIDLLISGINLNKPTGQRNKAMLETLYSCGLTVSELLNLKITNLLFDQGFIKVEGKADTERLVPVNGMVVDEIIKYLSGYRKTLKVNNECKNVLFLSRNGRKLSRVMIFTIIKNLSEDIGFNKNISPYTFRHSFAMHLINGGVNLIDVQVLLGHKSIITTDIYKLINKSK